MTTKVNFSCAFTFFFVPLQRKGHLTPTQYKAFMKASRFLYPFMGS